MRHGAAGFFAGNFSRMLPAVVFAALVTVRMPLAAAHVSRATYLILAKPDAYSLLNRYQQEPSDAEKRSIMAYSPFRIVDENSFLGDQITPAMKADLFGVDYYFLKDDKGALAGDKENPYRQSFRNCEVVGDSVRVAPGRSVRLWRMYPSTGGSVIASAGDILVRVLKYNGLHYCLLAGSRPQFGWCGLTTADVTPLRAADPAVSSSGVSPMIRNRVVNRMLGANRTYQELFAHFNRTTGQQKSAPYWAVDTSGPAIRCLLKGGYNYATLMQESTEYLVQDLKTMLVNEPFRVLAAEGVITVERIGTGGGR